MDKTNKTPRKCLRCKTTFVPHSNAQKYCSKTCSYVEWYGRYVKHKKPGKVLKCSFCNEIIKRRNATRYCSRLHQKIGAYLLIIKAQERDGYITRRQRIDLFEKYKTRQALIIKNKKKEVTTDAVLRG